MVEYKILISDGSGLQRKSTHRLRMGACKYQCASRLRTNSANCINKLSVAINRAVLSMRRALRGRECLFDILTSYEANRLSATKESASATIRDKYFVKYYPIKLYHAIQIRQLKNTPQRSVVVGCLWLTIPSVRLLRGYTCASCSIRYATTTSTTNKVNRRIIVIVPPYGFSFIAEATHHPYFMTNQPKAKLTISAGCLKN